MKRRIGNARIDKALLVPGKEPPALLGSFKSKGRGHINRLVQRPVVTLRVITMMNGTCGETGFGIGFIVYRHGGAPEIAFVIPPYPQGLCQMIESAGFRHFPTKCSLAICK